MLQEEVERDGAPEVDAFLGQHLDELAAAWADAVRKRLPESHYARMPYDELLSAARVGFSWCNGSPRGLGGALWPETGILSPSYLLTTGFGIGDVMAAALLAIDVMTRVLHGACLPVNREEALRAEIMASQLRLVGNFTEALVEETRRQVTEEQKRTAMVLEAAKAASSTLNLSDALRRAAIVLSAAAGTPHCWFYLLHRGGISGGSWAETGDPEFTARSPVELLASYLLSPVVEQEMPLVCRDAQADPRVANEWVRRHGLKSVLAVPFVVDKRVLGVAVALSFDEHRQFAPEQIELAQGIANVVAPSIENARLHRRVEKIAVMEERLRLARELHDSVAQELGYLILKTAATRELVATRESEQVESALAEIAGIAEEAYLGLREAIFSLRVATHSGPEFWPALREYMHEYQTHYGVEVRLLADESSGVMFSPKVATQLSRIILEALANVRKHSKARRAWVRAEREGSQFRLTVEDDGQGFDAARVAEAGGSQIGLEIMRERAESIGGSLELDSGPGKGTRVVVRVPIEQRG